VSDPTIGESRLVTIVKSSGTFLLLRVYLVRPEAVDRELGETFCLLYPSRMAKAQSITPLGPKWIEGICHNDHCWKVKNDEPCHRYRGKVEVLDKL